MHFCFTHTAFLFLSLPGECVFWSSNRSIRSLPVLFAPSQILIPCISFSIEQGSRQAGRQAAGRQQAGSRQATRQADVVPMDHVAPPSTSSFSQSVIVDPSQLLLARSFPVLFPKHDLWFISSIHFPIHRTKKKEEAGRCIGVSQVAPHSSFSFRKAWLWTYMVICHDICLPSNSKSI